MQVTILFGGTNRERLVSVASAQSVAAALPDSELWFWGPDDILRRYDRAALLQHQRPFEIDLPAEGAVLGDLGQALGCARREERLLFIALHGGAAENGDLPAQCEALGVPFTGSGSTASRLAFDKVAAKAVAQDLGVPTPRSLSYDDALASLRGGGRVIAKPCADGSSYGLHFISEPGELEALRAIVDCDAYVIEEMVSGVEATCAVIEHDGELIALPPVEIRAAGDRFDYAAKYISKSTVEICPSTFSDDVVEALKAGAKAVHEAVGAFGYSRTDFIVGGSGPVFLEINTLPGLTQSSLLPKALAAEGLQVTAFLQEQIELARRRAAS